MEKIRVIAKEAGKRAEIKEIENSYEAISKFIGGSIEFSPYPTLKNVNIICDGEYLLKGLPATVAIPEHDNVIAGNCLIVGDDEGETISLMDGQIQQILDDMKRREFCDLTISVEDAYYAIQAVKMFKKDMQM